MTCAHQPVQAVQMDFVNSCYAAEADGNITFATFRLRPEAAGQCGCLMDCFRLIGGVQQNCSYDGSAPLRSVIQPALVTALR